MAQDRRRATRDRRRAKPVAQAAEATPKPKPPGDTNNLPQTPLVKAFSLGSGKGTIEVFLPGEPGYEEAKAAREAREAGGHVYHPQRGPQQSAAPNNAGLLAWLKSLPKGTTFRVVLPEEPEEPRQSGQLRPFRPQVFEDPPQPPASRPRERMRQVHRSELLRKRVATLDALNKKPLRGKPD